MITREGGLAIDVRGAAGAPPLVVVGPGPGFPLLQDVRRLERVLGLEAWHVAYLEQRGTGRSRSAGAGDDAPTIARSIDDVAAVVRRHADAAGAPAVVLGMSLGASYAVAAAARDPEPFRAIVGLGLDVDIPAADAAAHAFVVAEAGARGNRRALAAADSFAAPTTARAFQARARWLADLDGMMPGTRWGTMMRRAFVDLVRGYGPIGAVRAMRAMGRVQDAMLPALSTWHLRDVRRLAVPLALVHGARDAVSPVHLVRAWLDALTSTSTKSLEVVDGIGHLPDAEAPEIVRAALARVAAPEASSGRAIAS